MKTHTHVHIRQQPTKFHSPSLNFYSSFDPRNNPLNPKDVHVHYI
jgi:hypothetical protein